MRRSQLLLILAVIAGCAAFYANHSLALDGEPLRARLIASFGSAVGAVLEVLVVMRLWLGRRG
jgi:hypothetical protein